MSFLNQLKSQAQTLQAQSVADQKRQQQVVDAVERAAHTTWRYLDELAEHLRVLQPDGPRLTADGKTPWPAMRATDFRVDARKMKVDDKDRFDYVVMGWRLSPKMGVVVQGSVTSNLLVEAKQIESRLDAGQVQYERCETRVGPRNTFQSVRLDYQTEARGMVRVKPRHATGELEFRLVCVTGLEVATRMVDAVQFQGQLLDELAKLLVGQASAFLEP